MSRSMIPPVSLKGQPVPVERFAQFTPHTAPSTPGYGLRTDTPAGREAVAVLARRSRARL